MLANVDAAKPSLTLERRIAAPPPKVYAAWTEPEKLSRWFGPQGSEVLSIEADARVGGSFRFVIRGPDGEEHDVSGRYREVVPDRKLVFTWAWRSTPERESLVTVLLEAEGGGTLLTLTHERFFDEGARDRHRNGWTQSLTRLAASVA